MRVKVCTMSEIGDGEVRTFEAEGTEGVIIRSGGRFFAIQRYCTHELFPMEYGMLQDESTLRCTFHGADFDLETGKALGPPAEEALATYPVMIKGEDVIVDLPT